jgi:hypothetical protein
MRDEFVLPRSVFTLSRPSCAEFGIGEFVLQPAI